MILHPPLRRFWRPSPASRSVSLAGAPFVLLLAFAIGTSGCKHGYSSDGASAGTSSPAGALLAPQPIDLAVRPHTGRLIIPLAVGNRWDYSIRFRSTITTPDGQQPPVTGESPLASEITGTATIGAR